MRFVAACLLLAISLAAPAQQPRDVEGAKRTVAAIEELLKQRPNDATLYFWLARFRAELDDVKGCVAALDKALQAKGYRRIDDLHQADIAVAYRVGVRDVQQVSVKDSGAQSAGEAAVACNSEGCSQIVTQGPDHMPTIKTVDALGLSDTDRRKIFSGNAEKLLNMKFQ